jgi:hypothetical protein
LHDILDECLTRLHTGEITLEECLLEHPKVAEELEPLLEIAHQSTTIFAPPKPREHFVATSRTRIINQLRAKKSARRDRPRKSTRRRWSWRPAYTLASVLLTVLLLASSVSVAWASTDSLPGDTLYGIKRSIEEVRLAVSQDPWDDVVLLNQFTERRLDELEEVLAIDRSEDATVALEGYEDLLGRLLELSLTEDVSSWSEPLETILAGLDHHEQVLLDVRSKAPDNVKNAIDHAVISSSHGKQVIERLQQGESPSDIAPGQIKKSTDQPKTKGDENKNNSEKKRPNPKRKNKIPGPQNDPPRPR